MAYATYKNPPDFRRHLDARQRCVFYSIRFPSLTCAAIDRGAVDFSHPPEEKKTTKKVSPTLAMFSNFMNNKRNSQTAFFALIAKCLGIEWVVCASHKKCWRIAENFWGTSEKGNGKKHFVKFLPSLYHPPGRGDERPRGFSPVVEL